MQPQSAQDYKKLLSDVIKKQIVILGPDITLVKARNVRGLTIANDGTVTEIQGEPQELIRQLIDQFVQLSGLIVKKTMEPLLGNGIVVDAPIAITPPTIPAALEQVKSPVLQSNQTQTTQPIQNQNNESGIMNQGS